MHACVCVYVCVYVCMHATAYIHTHILHYYKVHEIYSDHYRGLNHVQVQLSVVLKQVVFGLTKEVVFH